MNKRLDSDIVTAIDQFARLGIEHPKIQYINSGKNGDVYAFEDAFAIKIFKKETRNKKDAFYLEQLRNVEGYPELYHDVPGKYMIMEYIKGKTLFEIDGRNSQLLKDYKNEIDKVIANTRFRGLYPHDLHLNNIMLDQRGKLYIVDVGKFSFKEPKMTYHLNGLWTSSPWSSPWTSPWTSPWSSFWSSSSSSSWW